MNFSNGYYENLIAKVRSPCGLRDRWDRITLKLKIYLFESALSAVTQNHLPVNELLSEFGFDKLPDVWEGGKIDTFQDNECRIFINKEQGLRVIYRLSRDDPRVRLQKISWDDSSECYVPETTLATDEKPHTDEEKFMVAYGMMCGSDVQN